MALLAALLIALLFGSGVYLVMRKNLFEIILGTILISHGVNLFLLTMGGWSPKIRPAVIVKDVTDPALYTNPLVQALLLTAIVISFAVTAFLIVLFARAYEETQDVEFAEKVAEEDQV